MLHFFFVSGQAVVVFLLALMCLYYARTSYYIGQGWTILLMLVFTGVAIFLRKPVSARPILFALIGSVFLVAGCTFIWLRFYLTKTSRELINTLCFDIYQVNIFKNSYV